MRKYLLLSVLFYSFSGLAAQDKPKVFIDQLKKTEIKETLVYPALVRSRVDSKITADANLIVIKRLVALGDKVEKGDKLLILRNQDTSVHFENKILRAPVSGIVASILVNQGEFVRSGAELIYLNNPNDVYGKVEVPISDFKSVTRGLKGKLTFGNVNRPDASVEIEVIGVGAAVDARTGTVPVELSIIGHDKSVLPGMIGVAELTLSANKLLLVKEKSLFYVGDKVFLPMLEQDKVKKVEVKLGRRHKEDIEIIDGVEIGQTYVKETPAYLADGAEVEIVKEK